MAAAEKGERKHIVGMLVNDEPGVLTRISGLFTRRGFNIDTIIVGKTNLKNLSHIVISLRGDDRVIEQLDRQLYKLIDVVKLADFDEASSVVREHCLIKVSSAEKTRAGLMKTCALHKAEVLSTDKDSAIIEIAGKPESIDSFIAAMSEYGIKELSRTGINALQRD
jgi:acetolactate synthase-1/3 small subunit